MDGVAEERRLAYVGITRARDRLTLSRAVTRTRFGKKEPTRPSRFLPEMFGKVQPGESLEPTPEPMAKTAPTNRKPRGFTKNRHFKRGK